MNLSDHIRSEIDTAESLAARGELTKAFGHLERAHVLGQTSTFEHTRIHWRMFKLGLRTRSLAEMWGQFIRIIGAATKTPFGIYPKGNTGGSNVWFFKPMPIAEDLKAILESTPDRVAGDKYH